ncbi:hypothetical protein VTJ04DRAFT_3628 [Mycothermus thermophilus]|uniref:uncharacterized protein n=1 Tax=Humicola insolens TaxID=85995 RepID=UPI0037431EF3
MTVMMCISPRLLEERKRRNFPHFDGGLSDKKHRESVAVVAVSPGRLTSALWGTVAWYVSSQPSPSSPSVLCINLSASVSALDVLPPLSPFGSRPCQCRWTLGS